MQFTREQARNLSGGGSSFFKLEDGNSALVRFLYNTIDDMIPVGAHIVKQNEQDKFGTVVLCGRETSDDPIDHCKWCAMGNKVLPRYVVPMYNEDSHEIQYWLRTSNFEQLLTAQVEELDQTKPISGQIFKIKRTGNDKSTQYMLIPTGNNDGKTKDSFGEIKTPEESNVIKPATYEFPVNNQGNYGNFGNNQGNYNNAQNNGFANQNFQSTRRTTDMF